MESLNISLKQGSLFERTIIVEDEDHKPRDLTGLTYTADLRHSYSSTRILASFVFEVKNQLTNRGEILWTLPHTALKSLPLVDNTKAVYDIKETDGYGNVRELFRGAAMIYPEATK